MFDFGKIEESRENNRRQKLQLLEKLRIDQPSRTPMVGDRVLCCASLMGAGCGFEWERIEAVVKELANTACLIEFKHRHGGEIDSMWILNAVITDFLEPVAEKEEPEQAQEP